MCFTVILIILFTACSVEEQKIVVPSARTTALLEKVESLKSRGDRIEKKLLLKKDSIESISGFSVKDFTNEDKDFVNLGSMSKDFVFDMRYATNNNFLKEKVYPCDKCYVRQEVAKALMNANINFMKLGYKIKFFDCYRPYSVQKKMWKIFPNPGYVADPKGGSVHNRGAAVDITLVTLEGEEVDMGTDFDHFGKEAHHSYTSHSDKVKKNRTMLRGVMVKYGFSPINTEWWHYNFSTGKKYKISDFVWSCD